MLTGCGGGRPPQVVDAAQIGDTFRWKGENVATSEVAGVLSMCEDVDQANVYGVSLPHRDGRIGMAAVVFKTPTPDLKRLAEIVMKECSEGGAEVVTLAQAAVVRATCIHPRRRRHRDDDYIQASEGGERRGL